LVILAGMTAQFINEIIDPRMRERDDTWIEIAEA
jgi:hypothetical protein